MKNARVKANCTMEDFFPLRVDNFSTGKSSSSASDLESRSLELPPPGLMALGPSTFSTIDFFLPRCPVLEGCAALSTISISTPSLTILLLPTTPSVDAPTEFALDLVTGLGEGVPLPLFATFGCFGGLPRLRGGASIPPVIAIKHLLQASIHSRYPALLVLFLTILTPPAHALGLFNFTRTFRIGNSEYWKRPTAENIAFPYLIPSASWLKCSLKKVSGELFTCHAF